jgi:protein-glutamine gamma-glutamyltransferase
VLRADTGTDLPTLGRYLALPPSLDPRVRRLADSLTAGAGTRIEQVRAVERWLSTSLGYTTELPDTHRDATVEGFLFRRREGHCEYFSTALALMLRAKGIPARNVTGFLGGEWNENGGYLAVTGNDAHSWVEAWFPGYGWVPFDATPAGRADAVGSDAWEGWAWPAFFWLDGVEYRWHKWVVDYNLERQITLFRGIGDLFSRGSGGGGGSAGRNRDGVGIRDALPWIVLIGGLGWALWGFRRRTGAALPPEARAYLALRRRYARAGYAPRRDGGVGPLAFAEILRRQEAPGAGEAGRVVDLYVRARFSGEALREEDRTELRESADAAKEALRRAPKRRPAGVG